MAAIGANATVVARKPNSRAQQVWLYGALVLLALVAALYEARATYDTLDGIVNYTPPVRAPFFMKGYPAAISSIEKEASDVGLMLGDRVTTLNGERIEGINTISSIIGNAKPGDRLETIALRQGRSLRAAIVLQGQPGAKNRFIGTALLIVLGLLMPWFSLFLGFYVALARPRDPIAWIVLGLLISFSQLVNSSMSDWGVWIRIPSEIYHFGTSSFWPFFMFLFGYYFPNPPGWDRKAPWLKWTVTAVFLVMGTVNTVLAVGMSEDMETFGPANAARSQVAGYENLVVFLVIGGGITLLAQKAFRAKVPDAKRRLRLLFAGIICSLTPILVLSIAAAITGKPFEKLPNWIALPAIFLLFLFPITLAYVIVVSRAMDVRMALRQGLQYAFARSGLVLLRILLLAAFLWIGYAAAQRLAGNVAAVAAFWIALIGLGVVIDIGLRGAGRWIDKRFFREAYNAEQVLSDLSEQVRAIRETEPLLNTVCGQIANSLHVSRMSVLLERDGAFHSFMDNGFDTHPQVEFLPGSAVISHLRESKEPPRVYFEDGDSWLYRKEGMDDHQRSQLAALDAELLLPLATKDRLLGFIAAGQKRSEEPYTKSDIRILSTVASQTGLALENAALTTAVAAEIAQRERLAREVEIAREVQERLFPQKFPSVECLDYSGMCRTALGVGGDYYDFLALPGDRFGFALGDVAGKGISAALLMASLQASLRGEAGHGAGNLAQLITNLNARVYEASTTNRYATFFYGQYTPAERLVEYVNGGHNPPILMRRVDGEWTPTTLDATGTVVGLLPSATYDMASIHLRPGDYLVLFTDGISEAMNHDDEEWGEERLTETIRACAESSLTAAETMRRVLSAADTFANGAKQHDDMTIVVLRSL